MSLPEQDTRKGDINVAEIKAPLVQEIAPGLVMMDLYDRNMEDTTSGYLLEADQLVAIEAGPGPSGELWLELLASRGHKPADLSYVVVTHVHLDHVGAAGYILQKCENAKVVVHPKGARFLANPAPLVEGSRNFFPNFDQTMLPVYPVAEERIISAQDGAVIECGNRKLTIMHGDGHNRNHFTILDSLTNGIFCGDAAGLIYPKLKQRKIDFCVPATVPNQFDPVAYRVSLEKIREQKPQTAFYTHFGPVSQPERYFEICLEMLEMMVQTAEDTFGGGEASWQALSPVLEGKIREYLAANGFPKDEPFPAKVYADIKINSQGLADWWNRKQQGK